MSSFLCSWCGKPSSLYCSCTRTPVYLCDLCFLPHRSKNPRLSHRALFVSTLPSAAFSQRLTYFTAGRVELLQNLSRIDECCADFSNAVETLIARVRKYQKDCLSRLQAIKAELSADISQALQEVEATLPQEDVLLMKPYSASLRNYSAGALTSFSFELDRTAIDTCLQSLLRIDYSQPTVPVVPPPSLTQSIIFSLTETTIKCFDISTLQRTRPVPITSFIKFNINSHWATIDAERVFLCGGDNDEDYATDPVWNTAYILSKTGAAQQLPNMTYGRSSPGLLVWDEAVLVFGSFYDNGGSACERLEFSSARWDMLPEMQKKRSSFCPVRLDNSVYLCGGMSNATVEVLEGLRMRLLEVSLPAGTRVLTCASGDSLVLLFPEHFCVLSKLGSNPILTTKSRQGGSLSICTNPLLWRGVIFNYEGGAICKYSAVDGRMMS